MWKFRDEVDDGQKGEMKTRLEALKEKIPCVLQLEAGLDRSGKEAAMDMVLYSEFETMEDLAAYAVHPEHLKVVEFVKPLVCDRAVVDYEC
jgi:hypothetical protein